MNNQKTIADLKNETDIVEYIGSVLQLKKAGANFKACCPFHGEDTPSLSVSPTKQIFKCFGCSIGGDVLDFIEKYNKVTNVEAINILRRYTNNEIPSYNQTPAQQTYKAQTKSKVEPKSKEVIQNKLNNIAKALINNNNKLKIFTLHYPQQMHLSNDSEMTCIINPIFEKLFEKHHLTVTPAYQKRLNYIITNILAYDSFFKCPAIIIKDHNMKVCDIAKYRPDKPDSFQDWSHPKYMYIKEEDKLPSRGADFLFPFSKEMDKIIDKNNFFFIGEGLKNSLNALLFGVPFISLESVSTDMKVELQNYIKEKAKTKLIIGAFDGDDKIDNNGNHTKGHGAYLKAKEVLGLDFENLFEFDSNIDFTDYMKNETSIVNFENRFEVLFIDVIKNKIATKKDF
jgi:hypothetical protein